MRRLNSNLAVSLQVIPGVPLVLLSFGIAFSLYRTYRDQTARGAMKRILQAVVAVLLVSPALSAQAPDATLDHFAPNEAVSASFAWEQGAQCTLSDRIGVVLRSDWQKRHWIKIAGKQVEFNDETNMRDAGLTRLEDLKVPPGNRLHALGGGLRGLHAVRVNDQFRIVFRFDGADAFDVRCTDYH